MTINDPSTAAPRGSRRPLWTLAVLAIGAALAVWCANYLLVGRPISQIHGADPRNSSFTMAAHYGHYVDPTTLVIDLQGHAGSASPADLLRGVFQAADAMQRADRAFTTVTLARDGKPVFVMAGADFLILGKSYAANENPIYLSRTLPEKLRHPDGTAAFGTWTGGWLGVVGRQMEDVNAMASQWVLGGELTPL